MRSCTLLLTVAMFAFAAPGLADEGAAPTPQAAAAPAPSPGSPATGADPAPSTAAGQKQAAADAAPVAPTDAKATAAPQDAGIDLLAIDVTPPDPGLTTDSIEIDPDQSAIPAEDPMDLMADLERESAPRAAGPLGPEAVDEHGHEGRIHTVVKHDTLWDISTAYLGTPWVWPSIWQDNGEITNPNLIVPGDRIWITAGEMRKVTHDEAEAMIAADNDVALDDSAPPAGIADDTAKTDETAWETPEDVMMADDTETAVLPVAPLTPSAGNDTGVTVQIVARESMGFISGRELEAATSILDSTTPRTWLAEGDMIDLGLGEGHVEVGDEFTVFRDAEPVRDLDDSRLLGYHVDILGWAVVRKVVGESAIAEIRMSNAEIHRGDLMIPRLTEPSEVAIKTSPDGIDGQIVFMPDSRTTMGGGDHVYLNRGTLHGFEVGSEVEVYKPGRLTEDRATGNRVMTADRIDAQMVLVEVKPDTSVAYVVRAKRELSLGDRVRAVTRVVASR